MKRRCKDFEIRFYEQILQRNPKFIQALECLGEAYTRRGFYQEGLSIDRRLAVLCPDSPMVYYNFACSLSLTADVDGALKALQRAVLLGYDDLRYLLKDPDLENVRKDARFNNFWHKCQKI